jgi:hypothetical protein
LEVPLEKDPLALPALPTSPVVMSSDPGTNNVTIRWKNSNDDDDLDDDDAYDDDASNVKISNVVSLSMANLGLIPPDAGSASQV